MSAACLGGFRVVSYERSSHKKNLSRPTPRAATSSSLPSEAEVKQRKAIDELLELRRIGSDWDGEGAAAPIPELVDAAISFVAQSHIEIAPSRIVPVNDGRVTLEWDFGKIFISLRIHTPKLGRAMTVNSDGSTEFSEVNLSDE